MILLFVSIIQLTTVLNITYITRIENPNGFVTAHRSIFVYTFTRSMLLCADILGMNEEKC